MLARMFADGILVRGNFMAKVGVRPPASGTKKFASDSLIRPWSLVLVRVQDLEHELVPLKSPV